LQELQGSKPIVPTTDTLLSRSGPFRIRASSASRDNRIFGGPPRVEAFQERLGGRIALVTDINVAGSKLLIYNLHLESRPNDELRLAQIKEVL
jgi:endonuclease/exonuclease/phosphatase family metal-dependent hydrolase